ncbi:MAG: hypothetical protein WDO70_00085 [Alphaproteobacteria bacterium]
MSLSQAVEQTSALRPLPLPGRDDIGGNSAGFGVGGAGREQAERIAPLPASRGVTGRSAQPESFVIVGYSPIVLPQAANVSFAAPRPRALDQTARPNLADHVVGFLLSANEVGYGGKEIASSAAATSQRAYRNTEAGFPRSSDSLFSITS